MARKIITSDMEDAICADYLSGMNGRRLAEKYGISGSAVSVIVRGRGLRPSGLRKFLTHEQVEQLVESYNAGLTTYEIADILGVRQCSVYYHVKRLNINRTVTEACRIYPVNEHVFDFIDNETAAYWLGFLAADGCIYERDNGVQLILSRDDINHLARFRDWIQPTRPIGIIKPHGTTREACRLTVQSKHLVTALAPLGIVPRKTYKLVARPDIPADMVRHYYRGYVDGDGCFGLYRYDRHNVVAFRLLATEPFLQEFQEWLSETVDVPPTKIRYHTGMWNIYKHGARQVAKIAELLYDDAAICLERKAVLARRIIALNSATKRRGRRFDEWIP